MKNFKGSQGKWGCVFTSDKKRAIRNSGGIICVLTKPTRYSGQDERYEKDLEENLNDQRLIAASPLLLNALQDLVRFCEENNVGTELELAYEAINAAVR